MSGSESLFRWAHRRRQLLLAPAWVVPLLWWTQRPGPGEIAPWLAGSLIFVAGEAVRIWSQSHIRRRLTSERSLVTSGPYGLVRHPLYVGNVLMVTGLVALTGSPWLAAAAFVWSGAIFDLSARYEERRLCETYPDYASFMASTPRWLPRTLRPGPAPSSPANWPQVLRAEASGFISLAAFIGRNILLTFLD